MLYTLGRFVRRAPRARTIFLFFFNDTATTEIYTLSLHDALPILVIRRRDRGTGLIIPIVGGALSLTHLAMGLAFFYFASLASDRKSTRLNSSHQIISYAVFCLKKKKQPPIKAN